MVSVHDMVDFFKNICLTISDGEMGDFTLYFNPEFIMMKEGQDRPIRVSDDFVKGIMFVRYDFFLEEYHDLKEEVKS